MSQENVNLVKSVHPPSGTDLSNLFNADAGQAPGLERVGSLLTEDCEVVAGEARGPIGLTGGHGLDGLLAVWREWLSPWETYWTEIEEFVDAGDDHVLVLVRDHGRLRGSDAEVDLAAASVWTVRDGKIARIEFHVDRGTAFEAVGLRE